MSYSSSPPPGLNLMRPPRLGGSKAPDRVGPSYNAAEGADRWSAQNPKVDVGKERLPCCCGRCSRKGCGFCVFIGLAIFSIIFGILFFNSPDFEPKLDTLEIQDIDLGFGDIAVDATFDIELINNNFAGVDVIDIDSSVTFGDIVVDIALFEVAELAPRTTQDVPARLSFELNFGDFGSVLELIGDCLGEGVADFLLETVATGQYLGVESSLEFDPEDFPLECSLGALLGGRATSRSSLSRVPEVYKRYFARALQEVKDYDDLYILFGEFKDEIDV